MTPFAYAGIGLIVLVLVGPCVFLDKFLTVIVMMLSVRSISSLQQFYKRRKKTDLMNPRRSNRINDAIAKVLIGSLLNDCMSIMGWLFILLSLTLASKEVSRTIPISLDIAGVIVFLLIGVICLKSKKWSARKGGQSNEI